MTILGDRWTVIPCGPLSHLRALPWWRVTLGMVRLYVLYVDYAMYFWARRDSIERNSYGNVAGWVAGWVGGCHTPHHSSFLRPLRRYKIPRGTPSAGALNTRGWENCRFSCDFRRISPFISETVRDRPMVTMKR